MKSLDDTNKKLKEQEDKVSSENEKLKKLQKEMEKLRNDIRDRQKYLIIERVLSKQLEQPLLI